MIVPPVLFGVDVLDVTRVTRAMSYSGPAYARHITSPAEPDLHSDPRMSTAASVAVKECLVKAVGGRPQGFSWHDFEAVGDLPVRGREWVQPLLASAVPQVEAATRVTLTESCTYTVRGASGEAALARFTPDHESDVVGISRWGYGADLIVAIAILITTSTGAL